MPHPEIDPKVIRTVCGILKANAGKSFAFDGPCRDVAVEIVAAVVNELAEMDRGDEADDEDGDEGGESDQAIQREYFRQADKD